VAQPLAVLDGSLRVRTVNAAFAERLRLPAGDVRGRLVYDLVGGPWDVPELHDLLDRALVHPQEADTPAFRAGLAGGGEEVTVYARPLAAWGEGERFILLGIEKGTPGRR
jgi:PAS domain-containing protein